MAIILRIDVDRPYGKRPVHRHVLSRISSDFYFPGLKALGYLKELEEMLCILTERKARAYVFFRRCTLPTPAVLGLMEKGRHEIGLHLENSRSYDTFTNERTALERHVGRKVSVVSKHGSGAAKYGYHHYPPYEPDRYVAWARQSGMRLFLGNFENPSLEAESNGDGFKFFPSAFWLEPHWRDVAKFNIGWLFHQARERDIVLLVHPDNILDSPELTESFVSLISGLE